MITVSLNEADFEYDIHSLVKAFYPKEDVKVFADSEKIAELEEKETPLFHMEVLFSRAENVISASVLNAKAKTGEPALASMQIQVDFSDRKETKNRLKRGIYQIFSEYTGQTLPWGTLTGIRPTKIPMSMLEEGKSEDEIRTFMADTYFCSPEKTELSIDIAKRELGLLNKLDYEKGYSLYIGIPFCPSTCLYCSFTSYPLSAWEKRVDEYLDALEKEIDYTAEQYRERHLNTIYIGGGTPTTLAPYQLDRLIRKIKSSFDLSHLLEFTVEAGRPDSITEDKLRVIRKHGVGRISINPQTMQQKTLDVIGRRHTVEDVVRIFHLARELGFDNINMDLIAGLPGEHPEEMEDTLRQIKELAPDSLTVHALAMKHGSRLTRERAASTEKQNYKQMARELEEMIDMARKAAGEMGLYPYYLYRQKNIAGNFENVGYAKVDKAGIYNILIMEEKQSIVAAGAGASTKVVLPYEIPAPGSKNGRMTNLIRIENVRDVGEYISRIDEMIERKGEWLWH